VANSQLYVAPPAQPSLGFLAVSPITFAKDPRGTKGEVLVAFSPGASGLEASATAFIPEGTLPPALAVGGDGYAIPATSANTSRYLVTSGELSGAVAADVQARTKGGGDPRFANDAQLAAFAKSIVDNEQFYKQTFNWTATSQLASAGEYPVSSYTLADGSLLELVTLTQTNTYKAQPGGCVLEPSQFFYQGGVRYFELINGPGRGTYGTITQTLLNTLAVVVPAKSSGRTVHVLGARQMVADWSTTPCQYRANPGSATGATVYS
jgi:hypothetical protein